MSEMGLAHSSQTVFPSSEFCVLCFWTFERDAENEPIWCLFRWGILNRFLFWENTVANISYSNVF